MAPVIMPGRLAYSLAGHDKGTTYIIVGEENGLFLLSDGRLKPLSAPKKQKAKHFQVGPVTELMDLFGKGEIVRDEDIRRVIKAARKGSIIYQED